MINRTLYKKEWKTNWVMLLIFLAVIAMYAVMIVAMFDPKMGESLQVMADSMPEVFAAFGMLEVGTTLLEFVTGYLYGILLTALPTVFIIILSNRLVAKYVEDGSMAYLLSVSQKRGRIIRTQAIFLVSALVVMVIFTVGCIGITGEIMFPKSLEMAALLRVNVGALGLWMMMAGVCFLCSCTFNETKLSLGFSSGIIVYSILVQMISQVGEKFAKLAYATPLTMFNPDGLIGNDKMSWTTCILMYAIGIGCMVAAVEIFKKKDLPI